MQDDLNLWLSHIEFCKQRVSQVLPVVYCTIAVVKWLHGRGGVLFSFPILVC